MKVSPGMDAGARTAVFGGGRARRRNAANGRGKPARPQVVRADDAVATVAGRLGARASASQSRAGVQVLPTRHGRAVVSADEMQQAVHGLRMLPAVDIALLAQYGLSIELVPVASLEGGLVGATKIVKPEGGAWVPVRIQVAVRHRLRGDRSIAEIVQHEVGHAISVIRHQDRSEAAAEAYAARY